ncbi:MAG: hypothetical protein M5U16_01740 [Hyphomicrobium sp.]|nr:hypothetical protein [Hyphomicrobium sp.]
MSARVLRGKQQGRRLRFAAIAALVIAAGAGMALGDNKPSTTDLRTGPIDVEARALAGFDRLDREKTQFGKLTWRGGLVLTSPAKNFGGWSGLAVDADGKGFFAISDAGAWMSGAIAYDDRQRPTALTSVRLGAIQSKSGVRCRARATATPRRWHCWRAPPKGAACSSPSSASTASCASTSRRVSCRRPRRR